jgi:hypothetical protein
VQVVAFGDIGGGCLTLCGRCAALDVITTMSASTAQRLIKAHLDHVTGADEG